ncbi:hypothetical protein FRC06_005513, partial [Ceratobasidium sp. 370]
MANRLKTGVVGAVLLASFAVLYLHSVMRLSHAALAALFGIPALAEVVTRQSNTDQSQ